MQRIEIMSANALRVIKDRLVMSAGRQGMLGLMIGLCFVRVVI